MSPAERVLLIDAAMRPRCAVGFLAGLQHAFHLAGRSGDALTASVLRILLRTDEIEAVMHMRAEWRGERSRARLRPGTSR